MSGPRTINIELSYKEKEEFMLRLKPECVTKVQFVEITTLANYFAITKNPLVCIETVKFSTEKLIVLIY